MTQIISYQEYQRLEKVSDLEDYLFTDYLTDTTNPQTKFILEHFFVNNKDKLATLNITYSIPAAICEIFSTYVGNPETPLGIDIDDQVESYIWGGMGIFICGMEEGGFNVRYGSPDGYVLNADGSEDILTRYIELKDNGLDYKQYVLRQRYKDGVMTNELFDTGVAFSIDGDNRGLLGVSGQQVPLETLGTTAGLQEQETISLPDGVNSPIVVVRNRYDKQHKYGRSELEKILPMTRSLEIQMVNMQDQFMKHLSSKLAIPANSANRSLLIETDSSGNQYLNIKNAEAFFIEAGEQIPQYVQNTNPFIESCFQYIDTLVRQICGVLSIPVEFLSIKAQGSAESAESRQVRMSSFVKKIELIRRDFTVALRKIHSIAKHWGVDVEDFMAEFPAIFPESKMQLAEEMSLAISAGFLSQQRAIERYQNINKEEAEQELGRILAANTSVNITENDFIPRGADETGGQGSEGAEE